MKRTKWKEEYMKLQMKNEELKKDLKECYGSTVYSRINNAYDKLKLMDETHVQNIYKDIKKDQPDSGSVQDWIGRSEGDVVNLINNLESLIDGTEWVLNIIERYNPE